MSWIASHCNWLHHNRFGWSHRRAISQCAVSCLFLPFPFNNLFLSAPSTGTRWNRQRRWTWLCSASRPTSAHRRGSRGCPCTSRSTPSTTPVPISWTDRPTGDTARWEQPQSPAWFIQLMMLFLLLTSFSSSQVKIFCDKGAERKLRDEERRAAKRRMTPSGKRRLDEMYHETFDRFVSLSVLVLIV